MAHFLSLSEKRVVNRFETELVWMGITVEGVYEHSLVYQHIHNTLEVPQVFRSDYN